MSQAETRRNKRLIKSLLADPKGVSYGELAKRFKISPARVHQIIKQEIPAFKKQRKKEEHICAVPECSEIYFHADGYIGARCPKHRRPHQFQKVKNKTVQPHS